MLFVHFIFILLGAGQGYGATVLSPSGVYPVKPELKDSGTAPKKALESFYSEMKMDFQSFDLNDNSGKPLMSTHTDQLIKLKKLPNEGAEQRTELTFERLMSTSEVTVPGMDKPFVTRSDLGAFFSTKPLVIVGDGKVAKRVEGVEKVRAQAMQEVTDTISRTTVLSLLNESLLLKTGAAVGQDSSCLNDFAKKKPGEKWKFSREEQGAKLEYECQFDGWSEAGGKKTALLRIRSGKQRTVRAQPNGVPGVAETEGTGTIYYEPESQESLMHMETKITVLPTDEEQRSLKRKNQPVPGNRSLMKHWNHVYPI